MRNTLKTFPLFLLMAGFLLLAMSPAAAQVSHTIELESPYPTSQSPTRVILSGNDLCCGPVPRQFHHIEVKESTIRIYSTAVLGGVLSPPTPPYDFTVNLGKLATGEYTVIHLGIDADTDEITQLAELHFGVALGVEFTAVLPTYPGPEDELVFELTGIGGCPIVELVEIDGFKVVLNWDPTGCLFPPTLVTVASDSIGTLPVGSYAVEIRSWIGSEYQVVGTGRFRVSKQR